MTLKNYKPTTPSKRRLLTSDFKKNQIWRGKPIKRLVTNLKKTGGRNNNGQISSYHKGGGHKKLYRNIDFSRSIREIKGYVKRIEYDPNRSSYIALIIYENGLLQYILAPKGLKVSDTIVSSNKENINIKIGNSLPLKYTPVGTLINNVELRPKGGGQLARSAGSYAKVIKKGDKTVVIRLKSGKLIELINSCLCTIGEISNETYKNINSGKAGRSRWLGIRPTVRGVAMNPIDHPHGGGEGKTSGGRCSVTPWGISTKGFKTRKKNN
jgi:large subunit ribosomal protein L2